MKVAYVTTYDAMDRRQWSGSGSAILEALRAQGIEVTPIGPLCQRFELLGRVKRRIYGQFTTKVYDFEREALAGWDYARQVSERLHEGSFDLVFSPGTIPVARLRCPHPIVIWSDATFGSLTSLYDRERPLCGETLRAGHRTEHLALANSKLAIFASEWAARSAIDDYGADPGRVEVVPFGANFKEPPSRTNAFELIRSRRSDACELISIGVDWIRKDMPRAIELAATLNARGLPTRLTIAGCMPPVGYEVPAFVQLAGFIDKRIPEGERALSSMLGRSHFHVLFSTAECFGVVFAEANAHAVPNIANDIGGIPSAVANGAGGQRFAPAVPLGSIADFVEAHVRDPQRYEQLARAARHEYDTRLNWSASGGRVAQLLERVI